MASMEMTYSEWTAKAKALYGTAGKAVNELGITTSAVYKSAGSDSEGQVHIKYQYMLLGLEYASNEFIQRCIKHEKSLLLNASLDQLDSK